MLFMEPPLNRCESDATDDHIEAGRRRDAQEIARRCIVLCCVSACRSFPPGEFNEWLQAEGLWGDLSPLEVELLTSSQPTEKQFINSSWRSEALQVLLWSICKLAGLPPLTELVNVVNMLDVMPLRDSDTAEFTSSATLRPESEIDSELEKIVSAHWKIRNARNHPNDMHEPMIEGVVVERHWALEWIVNYDDEPWDQVPLTT